MFGSMSEAVATEELVGGKYRLTRIIGRGGMGTVWEGVHTSLSTQVAVKFIDTEYADSEELRRRFVNEARAAAQLQSKHVIQVYDQGVMEDGRPFIVMEFLTGEPLDRRLDRLGTLPPKDVARIVLHVCRGLSKAHAAGIIHRDLKPENVFLVWDDEDKEDVAKVVDFGIAKFVDEGLVGSSATRTGSLLGTPFYMSPEQARGLRSIDVRSDLWSVGVIAHRCLVGELPFEGEAFGDMLVKICTGDTPVPSSSAEVPPGFDAFIAKALAKQPDERFQSAQELAESLAAVCGLSIPSSTREGRGTVTGPLEMPEAELSGAETSDASDASVSFTRSIPATPRRWPWVLAAIVAIGVALVTFWSWGSASDVESDAELAADGESNLLAEPAARGETGESAETNAGVPSPGAPDLGKNAAAGAEKGATQPASAKAAPAKPRRQARPQPSRKPAKARKSSSASSKKKKKGPSKAKAPAEDPLGY